MNCNWCLKKLSFNDELSGKCQSCGCFIYDSDFSDGAGSNSIYEQSFEQYVPERHLLPEDF